MKPITFRARRQGDIVELSGYPTGVPGLLVASITVRACRICADSVSDGPRPGPWVVIHARPGAIAACGLASPEAALAAAQEMGPLTDWQQTAAGVVGASHVEASRWALGHGLARVVNEIAEWWGGHAGAGHPRNFVDNGVIA